jgi:hypothetical protein
MICFHGVHAQKKYEKESRLEEKDVPSFALQFIDSLEVQGKVKWYLEEGLDRTSIEAKFKSDKLNHSIEFDTAGNLEDVEILLKWNDMEESLKDAIINGICADCAKINIQRTQIHYTGDRSALWSMVKTGKTTEKYTIRYEIVARCRTASDTVLYEYLFSDTGQILSRSEIIFKNSSNLEY